MIARRQFLIASGVSIGSWGLASWIPSWETSSAGAHPPCSAPCALSSAQGTIAASGPADAMTDRQALVAPQGLLIFDPELPTGRAVAARTHLDTKGYESLLVPLEGDPGALWYREILPMLAPGGPRHASAIRGWTSHADFFVLSTLAASIGLSISSEPCTSIPERSARFPLVMGVPQGPREVAWNFTLPT